MNLLGFDDRGLSFKVTAGLKLINSTNAFELQTPLGVGGGGGGHLFPQKTPSLFHTISGKISAVRSTNDCLDDDLLHCWRLINDKSFKDCLTHFVFH